MPTTRIEIENYNQKWIATIELGGATAKRHVIRAESFDETMTQISEFYRANAPAVDRPRGSVQVPEPLPVPRRGRHPNSCQCDGCMAKRAAGAASA